MKELILTDTTGQELLIQYRKSAVFILKKIEMTSSNKNKVHPDMFHLDDHYQKFCFNQETLPIIVEQLMQVASQAWTSFEPKVADSLGADHDEYYDRDFDNNGSASVGLKAFSFEGPYQPISKDHFLRLYKFNKRKFESFLFDCIEQIQKEGTS